MLSAPINSWGNLQNEPQAVIEYGDRHLDLAKWLPQTASLLPFGNGRSYGDSCLNHQGSLIRTRQLDRFIQFDAENGILRCEAGVLFDDILRLVVPQGWFISVTPGTRFISVGGAIANDVHGKNHHIRGTFGCHLQSFELLRSSGERLMCSPQENSAWFNATIGGLGLTGLITWAQFQLRRIHNPWINTETLRFHHLDEFFTLSQASDQEYEYTVAWIDCLAQGAQLGRGLFIRGNHAPELDEIPVYQSRQRHFPVTPPVSLINKLSLRIFNTFYYHQGNSDHQQALQHYEPFFYPLDGILEWNKVYGPHGFYQYQCVIPYVHSHAAIKEMLQEIGKSSLGSFLAVLKLCGEHRSPGMLSFPMHGVSLALDFPNRGATLQKLFTQLDQIVRAANGRLYPAKDARMPATMFQETYPQWQNFSHFIDPHFSSNFWRRVTT